MTRMELANKLLDKLQDFGMWMGTTHLRREMGITQEGHASMRAILSHMASKKIIRRDGVGKFRWKINVKAWNRVNPMKEPDPNSLLVSDFKAPKDDDGMTADPSDVLKDIEEEVEETREEVVSVQAYDDTEIKERLDKLEKKVDDLASSIKRNCAVIEVKRYDGTVLKLKNVVFPKQFEEVMDLVRCRRNVLLVGPAGCGKTHLARLVSKSLKFQRFGSVNCTAGMSEAHLLGRGIPNLTTGKNRFQGTDFLTCYEEGGLFLFDELDAADPNMLLAINSALANGYCNVPNRADEPRADQHEDFAAVGTANTIGRGATRMYAGRNQLDEATLDRFRIGYVECDYDEVVEASLCPDDELRDKLRKIRTAVEEAGMRRIVSSRFMRDAFVMKKNADWTTEKVVEVLTRGWTVDEKRKVQYV